MSLCHWEYHKGFLFKWKCHRWLLSNWALQEEPFGKICPKILKIVHEGDQEKWGEGGCPILTLKTNKTVMTAIHKNIKQKGKVYVHTDKLHATCILDTSSSYELLTWSLGHVWNESPYGTCGCVIWSHHVLPLLEHLPTWQNSHFSRIPVKLHKWWCVCVCVQTVSWDNTDGVTLGPISPVLLDMMAGVMIDIQSFSTLCYRDTGNYITTSIS